MDSLKANKTTTTVSLANCNKGDVFTFGGYGWVKLERVDADDPHKGTYCITKDIICNKAFDEYKGNNWRTSTLRKWLNDFDGEFLHNIDHNIANGAERSVLLPITSDLTSDDGDKSYGTATDYVALLTCDLYRKYRDLIPNANDWWWTLTPWYIDKYDASYSYGVRYVSTSGSLNSYFACSGSGGVRPLCLLKSDIPVEVESSNAAEAQPANLATATLTDIHKAWESVGNMKFIDIWSAVNKTKPATVKTNATYKADGIIEHCPACDGVLDYFTDNDWVIGHCPWCGQALDWADESEDSE